MQIDPFLTGTFVIKNVNTRDSIEINRDNFFFFFNYYFEEGNINSIKLNNLFKHQILMNNKFQ